MIDILRQINKEKNLIDQELEQKDERLEFYRAFFKNSSCTTLNDAISANHCDLAIAIILNLSPHLSVEDVKEVVYGNEDIFANLNFQAISDITRLIDIIQKYLPMLDSENIICLGNSGGGTTTYYAACIDERIKISVPSCSVCTYEDSIVAMMHCACNFIPNIANCFDMGDLGGIIALRKLIVVNGKNDPVFPEKGVKKSYELIKKMYSYAGVPENCSLVTGDGGHRFYADIAWQKINEFVG